VRIKTFSSKSNELRLRSQLFPFVNLLDGKFSLIGQEMLERFFREQLAQALGDTAIHVCDPKRILT